MDALLMRRLQVRKLFKYDDLSRHPFLLRRIANMYTPGCWRTLPIKTLLDGAKMETRLSS